MKKYVIVSLLVFISIISQAQSSIYVSVTNGNDNSGTGTINNPFKSISKAIDFSNTDGEKIFIEAGIYNSISTGANNEDSILISKDKSLTFVAVKTIDQNHVEITNGITINTSGVVSLGESGEKFFLGSSPNALKLLKGTLNIHPENVIIGNGGTLTINDVSKINLPPTISSNLNVLYTGVGTVLAKNILPADLGNGQFTCSKTSGILTIEQDNLNIGSILVSGGGILIFKGNVSCANVILQEGNLEFQGNLTLGNGTGGNLIDLTNNGNGTLTVGSGKQDALNFLSTGNKFDNENENPVGSIINNGTGKIVVNAGINYQIENTNTINSICNVKLINNSSGLLKVRNAELKGTEGVPGVINTANGTIILGEIGDTITTGYSILNNFIASNLIVNAALIVGSGKNLGNLKNNGKIYINNSGSQINGSLINFGNIQLNSNVLTLSGTDSLILANIEGNIYSDLIGTVGNGFIKFTGAAPIIEGEGSYPGLKFFSDDTGVIIFNGGKVYGDFIVNTSGLLRLNGFTDILSNCILEKGNIKLEANLKVRKNFQMNDGVFQFSDKVLEVSGDFKKNAGRINDDDAGRGTLKFVGANNQYFYSANGMSVYNVEISHTGNQALNENNVFQEFTLDVLNNFTINSGKLNLFENSIRMKQAEGDAKFINNGAGYVVSGKGSLIFNGIGTSTEYASDGIKNGAVISGAQPFSNLTIDFMESESDLFCLGDVVVSDNLNLLRGGIAWNMNNDGSDFFSTSTLTLDTSISGSGYPAIFVSTDNNFSNSVLRDGFARGIKKLKITSNYNLIYEGSSDLVIGDEFVDNSVRDLKIATKNSNIITAPEKNITINGSLVINEGQKLDFYNKGIRTLTATSNTTHYIYGAFINGILKINGSSTLIGNSKVGTNNGKIDNLYISNGAVNFNSINIQHIGVLKIEDPNVNAKIKLNSVSNSVKDIIVDAGLCDLDMHGAASNHTGMLIISDGKLIYSRNDNSLLTSSINGNVFLTGGKFIQNSDVTFLSSVTHQNALWEIGDYDAVLKNSYSKEGSGNFSAVKGKFIASAEGKQTYSFIQNTQIPNFVVDGKTNVIDIKFSGLDVQNLFHFKSGTINLNSYSLKISGNDFVYENGSFISSKPTGKLIFSGDSTNVLLYSNIILPYAEVDMPAGKLYVNTNDTTPRKILITGQFIHTLGNIDLSINDLELTDNGIENASFYSQKNAGIITGISVGNIGELVFNGSITSPHIMSFEQNNLIQNIKINSLVTKTDLNTLHIEKNISLVSGSFSFLNSRFLSIGNNATIKKSKGSFGRSPSFSFAVNVEYFGEEIITGNELPAGSDILNDLTINVGDKNVTLGSNVQVNGTLYLKSGVFIISPNNVIIGDNGKINIGEGAFAEKTNTSPNTPIAESYILEYSTSSGQIFTGQEFIDSAVTVLRYTGGANLLLTETRTVGAFIMDPVDSTNIFSLGTTETPTGLTVNGNIEIKKGNLTTIETPGISNGVGKLSVQGNLTISGKSTGFGKSGKFKGINLELNGEGDKTFLINRDQAIIDLILNMENLQVTPKIRLLGGNLEVNGSLNFINGVLKIENEDNYIALNNPGGSTLQGYTRNVDKENLSHIVGKVRKELKLSAYPQFGRSEFPVGSETAYRPAAITIIDPNATKSNLGVFAYISNVERQPAGIAGLPIKNGVSEGVDITRRPNFYWDISTSAALGTNIVFDLDLQAQNFTDYSNISNIRIIRREGTDAEVTNEWLLHGKSSAYDNYVRSGIVSVANIAANSGLLKDGAIFTYGLKTKLSVANPIADQTVASVSVDPVVINLTGVFEGNMGALTFTASSTNTSVATAAIVGDSTVVVTPIGKGATEITVRAADIDDDFLTTKFNFRVDTSVGVEELGIPTEFALEQNYPNPFNPTTVIRFGLPEQSNVTLRVYNILGQEIAALLNTVKAAGWHEVNFNASQLGSGLYIYRIEAKDFVSIKKMMLVK